ncbi:MAG TPA: cellulose-binding protein, partial [Ktedonobacterales bacterium]
MLKNLKARHAAYTFLSTSLLLIAFVTNAGSAAAAGTAVQVAVNVKASLGTIPDTAFGLNTAAWDAHLLDPRAAQLLRQAGVNVLRFPGGSTADFYHWKTNTVTSTKDGSVNPKDTFDAFMKVAKQVGARPMLTVNYGSNAAGTSGGDPQEAADWVRYANSIKHYGVRYWEIGNELYGNGTYGAKWEVDLHKEKGPVAYAKNALVFIQAMKKVDPTIQIGLVLTAPGVWPDGSNPDWDSNVLSTACQQMDFAAVHWYPQEPGGESDSGLLSSTNQITSMVATLRARINKYCGSHASHVKIMITETNSVNFNPGKQTVSLVNGLFLADT